MDRYNGGAVIKVGDYTITKINSYRYEFTPIEKRFEAYDFREVTQFVGNRFSASVTCGSMTDDERKELESALKMHEFRFESDEFKGNVILDSYQQNLVHANTYGKHYRPTFSVTAVAPVGGGGL